jgi:hypothetical protein
LGEYIGRIFTETKHRPLYFVNELLNRRSESQRAEKKSDN